MSHPLYDTEEKRIPQEADKGKLQCNHVSLMAKMFYTLCKCQTNLRRTYIMASCSQWPRNNKINTRARRHLDTTKCIVDLSQNVMYRNNLQRIGVRFTNADLIKYLVLTYPICILSKSRPSAGFFPFRCCGFAWWITTEKIVIVGL